MGTRNRRSTEFTIPDNQWDHNIYNFKNTLKYPCCLYAHIWDHSFRKAINLDGRSCVLIVTPCILMGETIGFKDDNVA